MDEVAHVCNDYWPTARQLWKPAVVVVELGVTDCKYLLYRWISYTCNESIQLSSCTAPRCTLSHTQTLLLLHSLFLSLRLIVFGNPSRGRNDLIDVHLSNQELKDVHPAVEGNPSRERNDLIEVHLSNQDLKDVPPAVEANPSLGRNDLIDVYFSNQDLKDVHPAVEANPSLGRNDRTDVHLSSEDLKDVHPAVEANPSLGRNDLIDVHLFNEDLKDGHPAVETNDSVCPSPPRDRLAAYSVGAVKRNGGCIFFAQGHCPFGIDCWFSHLGGERSCIGEASTSRLGRCFSNELGLPGISPPPGNEHEPPWNNHERAAVANPSLGRNNLIDVQLSNQDLKDVHPAVEVNPSLGRNSLIDVHLSNQDLKDVHPAVEANPSLGRNNLIDVHLSNQDPKDVHPAVETNDSVCPSPLRDRLAADSVGAVKRNGGCIFFAQGHCPFGIDCWFSHLGSERSCIGEASTSRSGYWFSNELGLPGISPSTGNDDEPPGNDDEPPGNNSERAAVIRNIVCELENQSLLPDLVRELFGSAVYRSCCKEGKPRGISCWFQPEVQSLPIFNNQFLSWRSPKRSNSPWEDGVTRLDRRWVQLTVEEKNIVGPIRSKQEEDIVGLVRDQKVHLLCWAYVAVDLVSAMRLINGQDDTFVPLSVRELCFYARPRERFLRTVQKIAHRCHELRVEFAFDYIMSTGVRRQGGNEETFDCVEGGPGEGEDTVRIEDYTFLGKDFKAALKRLQLQPIGASLHVFEEYWDIKKGDIYRGPTSNSTKYYRLHAVVVVDAFFIDGELIFWCKSSSGKQLHDEGYIMVSAAIMVLGLHYESDNDEPTFGIRDERRSKTALYEPAYLISDFVYPRMKAKSKKGKRKRSDL
ncbi:hypothetical protein IGI04_032561 [Brassica rapa subsp. trilocularis]|uniref:C3H1-type domain-containing protein n=1 Tax=Brassica rapa subsp. trilocularis TaxID=1813537 RepID=A0ABQ7LWT2_BRACM|nr:hypothetical protein IGI04_032561 [Brassica rapa subsp. trilocularis]